MVVAALGMKIGRSGSAIAKRMFSDSGEGGGGSGIEKEVEAEAEWVRDDEEGSPMAGGFGGGGDLSVVVVAVVVGYLIRLAGITHHVAQLDGGRVDNVGTTSRDHHPRSRQLLRHGFEGKNSRGGTAQADLVYPSGPGNWRCGETGG